MFCFFTRINRPAGINLPREKVESVGNLGGQSLPRRKKDKQDPSRMRIMVVGQILQSPDGLEQSHEFHTMTTFPQAVFRSGRPCHCFGVFGSFCKRERNGSVSRIFPLPLPLSLPVFVVPVSLHNRTGITIFSTSPGSCQARHKHDGGPYLSFFFFPVSFASLQHVICPAVLPLPVRT